MRPATMKQAAALLGGLGLLLSAVYFYGLKGLAVRIIAVIALVGFCVLYQRSKGR
jgi:hypothetical protein